MLCHKQQRRWLTVLLDSCQYLLPDFLSVHSKVISTAQKELELDQAEVRILGQPFFIQSLERHPFKFKATLIEGSRVHVPVVYYDVINCGSKVKMVT